MDKKRVLFVCIHNSARSQMAEEYLRKLTGDRFDVESAGLEPGTLNPVVVELLLEDGMDIRDKKTQAVADLLEEGKSYDYVITVCDAGNSERCPIFPGTSEVINWNFTDPSGLGGSNEEKMAQTKEIRDQIVDQINSWLNSLND